MEYLPKIFVKYKKYTNILKTLPRATNLTLSLYEINESFAIKYLHEKNPNLFSVFLNDVIQINKVIQKKFNYEWEYTMKGSGQKTWQARKVLHICSVYLAKKVKKRIKFYKMVQENSRFFEIL